MGGGHHRVLRRFALGSLLATLCLFAGAPALAFDTENFVGPGDETIEAQITRLAARDSDAADRARDAEALLLSDEFLGAAQIYEGLAAEFPWWEAAPQRRCEALLRAEDRPTALQACREALTIRETDSTAVSLAWALSTRTLLSDRLTQRELAEAHLLLGDVLLRDASNVWAALVRCRVSEQRMDTRALRGCAQLLYDHAPELDQTWYFIWLNHAVRERWPEAEMAMRKAEALGIAPEVVELMRSQTEESRPSHALFAHRAAGPVMLWMLGWLCLALTGLLMSTATRRAAERLAREPIDAEPVLGAALRLGYRAVLVATCIYYWLSGPLLFSAALTGVAALLSIVATGAVLPGFAWMALAIFLVVAAGFGAQLLARKTARPPGPELTPEDHPHLWTLVHEVADTVGTRPIDRIYTDCYASIGVFETRGLGSAMRGAEGERCLVLGFGMLTGLTAGQLRSILAHEYGHFARGDTRLGEFALTVRRSLGGLLHLLSQGPAPRLNPGYWLTYGFAYVFQTLSRGASRLQEIQADRTAIRAYGTDLFVQAMQQTEHHGTWFTMNLNALMNEAFHHKTRLPNLFRSQASGEFAVTPKALAARQEAMRTEAGSLFETHPPTEDRVRWARALSVPGASVWNDGAPAPSLLGDPIAVETELNDWMRSDFADWRAYAGPR